MNDVTVRALVLIAKIGAALKEPVGTSVRPVQRDLDIRYRPYLCRLPLDDLEKHVEHSNIVRL